MRVQTFRCQQSAPLWCVHSSSSLQPGSRGPSMHKPKLLRRADKHLSFQPRKHTLRHCRATRRESAAPCSILHTRTSSPQKSLQQRNELNSVTRSRITSAVSLCSTFRRWTQLRSLRVHLGQADRRAGSPMPEGDGASSSPYPT